MPTVGVVTPTVSRGRASAIHVVVAIAAVAAVTTVAPPTSAAATVAHSAAAGPADPTDRSISAAAQFVAGPGRAALHIGAGDTLVRETVTAGERGLEYVSYQRTYRGLPVVGGDAVVVTNADGAVVASAAAQESVISVSTTASVASDLAATTSRAQLRTTTQATPPRLVVLAWGEPRLAWETVVTGFSATGPSRLHVFVDATAATVTGSYDEVRDGTGASFYNGTVAISTSGSGSSFSMTDPTRPGIRCGGQNGAVFTGADDLWGNGSGTNLETACVDTLYGVQREWDMLGSWLGRNGINGSGGGFPARVGLADVNAFWNGSFTNFGHPSDNQRQATPIDVVAHEFGHAIFQTTPGGTGGGNENGGINESTGDIFGALTEAFANNPNDPPDFTVGEGVNLLGSGPIRFMYNPSIVGDPNCWSSSIPNTEVHAAAGPLNHWFYLVSQGNNPAGGPASPICSGGPASVTGIGIQNAGRVYYNALLLKTSTWRYADVRVASLTAARNLFPGGCTEFNRVRDAWNAVGVPAQPGEPTCAVTIDDPRFFVRQHYLDFLNREPDQGGWDFWTGQITQCGADAACVARKRTDVSLAFMYSTEFLSQHPGLRNPPGTTPDFNNGEFIRIAYLIYLRRAPDDGGYAFWLGQLNSANDYSAITTAFLTSTEYRNRF
jgi:Zn-dependent metalloprotease